MGSICQKDIGRQIWGEMRVQEMIKGFGRYFSVPYECSLSLAVYKNLSVKISSTLPLVWMWDLFSYNCNTVKEEVIKQLGFFQILKKHFITL